MAFVSVEEQTQFPSVALPQRLIYLSANSGVYTGGKIYELRAIGEVTAVLAPGAVVIPVDTQVDAHIGDSDFVSGIGVGTFVGFQTDPEDNQYQVTAVAPGTISINPPLVNALAIGDYVNAWMDTGIATPITDAFKRNVTLNRVNFVGRDFNTWLNEAIGFLAQNFGTAFTDFSENDLGMMLAQLTAFALDELSFYTDQRATDSFIETAQTLSAVSRHAQNVGYKPNGAVPNSVTIAVAVDNRTIAPGPAIPAFVIPKFSELIAANGLTYVTTQSLSFGVTANAVVGAPIPAITQAQFDGTVAAPAGVQILRVTVVEGVITEEIFVSDGTPNQVFKLLALPDGSFVGGGGGDTLGLMETKVAGITWTEEEFLLFDPTAEEYQVNRTFDPPEVVFGDNLRGKIPNTGDEVRIKYLATRGKSGGISSFQLTSFDSTFPVAPATLVVNQASASSGGSNPEDIESIQANAPAVFATATRAVTKPDFDALSNAFSDPNFGAVGKSSAEIVRDISLDLFLTQYLASINETPTKSPLTFAGVTSNLYNYLNSVVSASAKANHVVISVLTLDQNDIYTSPSVGLLTVLKTFLDGIKVVPVTVETQDAITRVFRAQLNIELRIDSRFVATDVVNNVRDALVPLLKMKEFGSALRLGDLYQAIEAVDGVTFSHVTITCPTDPTKITSDGDMEVGVLEVVEGIPEDTSLTVITQI